MDWMAIRNRVPLLLGAMMLAGSAVAGPGYWTITGPDGGQVSGVAIDANDPDRAVAIGRGGVFRTMDGGASWQRHQQGLEPGYGYLLRGGRHGDRMYLMPGTRQLYRGDIDGVWQPATLPLAPGAWVRDVAIHPADDERLMVLVEPNQLLSSTDGGGSFSPVAMSGVPAGAVMVKLAYATPTRLLAVYLETGSNLTGLLRSEDGGASWTTGVQANIVGGSQAQLRTSSVDADRLYLSAPDRVRRSDDAGATLVDCAALPGDDWPTTIELEPDEADRVWVGGRRGLYRSTDGCASWIVHGAGISSDGLRPDSISIIAFAGNFSTSSRMLVGSLSGGLYRSDNAGLSFALHAQGFTSHNIRALAAHPAQPGHLWAGHGDAMDPNGTVWRSTDAAASWQLSNSGLNALHLRGITVDPTTASLPSGPHLYGMGSSMWSVAPATHVLDGGIYKSVDGGLSWSTIDNGLPATYMGTRYIGTVRGAVLDPRSCATPPASGPCTEGPLQTIYVAASGRASHDTGTYAAARIYKSTDAGATWTASENGLPAPGIDPGADDCWYSQIAVPLVIDPHNPQTLYVGLSLFWQQGDPACPVPSVANGVFKSTDGGANWVHSSNGLHRIAGPASSHGSVLALAVAPSQPQRLYASAWREDFVGRIFRSDDGGASWTERSVGVVGQDVRHLLVDPVNPDIVYAAGAGGLAAGSGVYRSEDGGLTWDSISLGLEGVSVTTLLFDPHEPTRLYAGTVSGVAEYSRVPDDDSDGVPGDIEDQAPNGGDGNFDGVPDSQQSHVASLPGVVGSIARSADGWVTVWVEALEGSCERINNMEVIAAQDLPADIARGGGATAFDNGVLRFQLPDCQQADVHVRFHGADHSHPAFGWRNYGPPVPGDTTSIGWYDFADASRTAPDTWTLRLRTGEPGDWFDNGEVIRFVGGAGYLDLSLFADGFESVD